MIKIDAAVLLQMLNRVKKFAGTDNEFILNTAIYLRTFSESHTFSDGSREEPWNSPPGP